MGDLRGDDVLRGRGTGGGDGPAGGEPRERGGEGGRHGPGVAAGQVIRRARKLDAERFRQATIMGTMSQFNIKDLTLDLLC